MDEKMIIYADKKNNKYFAIRTIIRENKKRETNHWFETETEVKQFIDNEIKKSKERGKSLWRDEDENKND